VHVFVSYRRSDVGGYAGRLTDALVDRFGVRGVFHDVSAIAPGTDFTQEIDRALDGCDALLAVIGPGWLTASTSTGLPRLTEANDYVRLELASALERAIPVVPVLVGEATLPDAADLPAELRKLVQRQSVVIHDATWHDDVNGLVRSLRGEPSMPVRRRRRWLFAAAAAAVAIGGVAMWRLWPEGDGSGSGALPKCEVPGETGWSTITLNAEPSATVMMDDGQLQFRVRDASWRAVTPEVWQVTLTMLMENKTETAQDHGKYFYEGLTVAQRSAPAACFSGSPDNVAPADIGQAVVGFSVRCEPSGLMQLRFSGDSATPRLTITKDLVPSDC
jgi:hypothetical protein